MIFIVVKWNVRPEHADNWPEIVKDFTAGTRSEPGNIFFEWSRSVEEPNSYVLVEAFQDGAGGDHVNSQHFKDAIAMLPDYVASTPEIVSQEIPDATGWGEMAEVKPR